MDKYKLGTIALVFWLVFLFLLGTTPRSISNSIAGRMAREQTEDTAYLAGMERTAVTLAEAVDRNSALIVYIQQAPELLYDPVVTVIWHQNVIIAGVVRDVWAEQIPPADYYGLHTGAQNTAAMCHDLLRITENALWPPEGMNTPRPDWLAMRLNRLHHGCIDGLLALFTIFEPSGAHEG